MIDFEALRKERNDAIVRMLETERRRMGITGPLQHNFNFNACYCACVSGGPCEHKFEGWRDILNDNGEVCGGETVCTRCNMGAMAHTLRCCD